MDVKYSRLVEADIRQAVTETLFFKDQVECITQSDETWTKFGLRVRSDWSLS